MLLTAPPGHSRDIISDDTVDQGSGLEEAMGFLGGEVSLSVSGSAGWCQALKGVRKGVLGVPGYTGSSC